MEYIVIFIIIALGYVLGKINICGLRIESSGILIVALIFGHFGFSIPSTIKNLGLICFVASVGLIAGPVFSNNLKKNAFKYIIIGLFIIITATVLCLMFMKIYNVPTTLALGLLSGALTSTPGLATALEITNDSLVSVGYGIAYPFGVIGVVLFVQIVPKLLKINFNEEIIELEKYKSSSPESSKNNKKLFIDQTSIFVLSLTIILGGIIGLIKIPINSKINFSLGLSGGPLLTGLFISNLDKCGLRFDINNKSMNIFRELGLDFFLVGAGIEAGSGFISVLNQYGVRLFIIGALITMIPMVFSFVLAHKIFKLNAINSLGSICGGMTSTPALGTLITTTKTDLVSATYAATYPVALITIVFFIQILCNMLI